MKNSGLQHFFQKYSYLDIRPNKSIYYFEKLKNWQVLELACVLCFNQPTF